MNWFVDFYRSSLGKKVVMAVTGILLFLFVVGHMAGNLKAFQGPEKLNSYAEWLRDVGSPALPHTGLLWIARIVLLGAVGLHVLAAVQLTLQNRRARPVDYQRRQGVQLDYAARTMRWSGVIIFFYVVYHLMHFTWGNAHRDFVPGDVFHNLVSAFQFWPVTAVYVVANLLLGVHLYHGLWSMFQSMGWSHPRYNSWRRAFAVTFAVVITVGFISVPLAVLVGVIS